MPYTTVFFDLDDTLYPPSTGLWQAIRHRMEAYMLRLGIHQDQIDGLRQHYLETYGTTLRGLQHYYQVDVEDYLRFVHDLPLAEFLTPDELVRQVIESLPLQKWIFTNADEAHARRVLKVLRLEGCFSGIIDVRAIGFSNKPEPSAYLQALQIAGESDASRCVMLDDALRNLLPAQQIGFTTVLVNPHPAAGSNGSGRHYSIESIVELPQVLPELWQQTERSG